MYRFLLTKIMIVFVFLFLGSFFVKWAVDVCAVPRVDMRIFKTGAGPESVCKWLQEMDSNARMSEITESSRALMSGEQQNLDSGIFSPKSLRRVRHFTFLFSDIPSKPDATLLLLILLTATSTIIGMIWQILWKVVDYNDPVTVQFPRRKTATMKIMPAFTKGDEDNWKPM